MSHVGPYVIVSHVVPHVRPHVGPHAGHMLGHMLCHMLGHILSHMMMCHTLGHMWCRLVFCEMSGNMFCCTYVRPQIAQHIGPVSHVRPSVGYMLKHMLGLSCVTQTCRNICWEFMLPRVEHPCLATYLLSLITFLKNQLHKKGKYYCKLRCLYLLHCMYRCSLLILVSSRIIQKPT